MTLYPGTGFAHQIGSGNGRGFTINIPIPVNAGYGSYELVFESIVEPVAKAFEPQVIILTGSVDAHFSDPLTRLGLPVRGFRMIGERVREMARVCNDKVIDFILSGYSIKASMHSRLALITALAGIELDIKEPEPIPERFGSDITLSQTEKVVSEAKGYLKDYWECL